MELFLWMGVFENYGTTSWFYNSITSPVRSGGEVRYSILVIISFRFNAISPRKWLISFTVSMMWALLEVDVFFSGRNHRYHCNLSQQYVYTSNCWYMIYMTSVWTSLTLLASLKGSHVTKNKETTLCHRLQPSFRMFSVQLKAAYNTLGFSGHVFGQPAWISQKTCGGSPQLPTQNG